MSDLTRDLFKMASGGTVNVAVLAKAASKLESLEALQKRFSDGVEMWIIEYLEDGWDYSFPLDSEEQAKAHYQSSKIAINRALGYKRILMVGEE